MKNLLKIFLVILCTVTLFGCGSNKTESKNDVNSKTEIEESNTKENNEPIYFLKTADFTKNDLNAILDKALKHTSLNTVDKIYYDINTIKDDGINARAKIAEAYFAHDFDVVVDNNKSRTSQKNALLLYVQFDCTIQDTSIYFNETDNKKFTYHYPLLIEDVYKVGDEIIVENVSTASSNNALATPIFVYEEYFKKHEEWTIAPIDAKEIKADTTIFYVNAYTGNKLEYKLDAYLSRKEIFDKETFKMERIHLQ